MNLVSEIDLPDDNPSGTRDRYLFAYEPTPGYSGDYTGRLASVTLPSGGTISYSYSGGSNGITCADGSTATLTRTTPDGTWTYAHTESGTAWTTTLTDPSSNQTTFNFQSVAPTGSTTMQTYETERQLPGGAETIYTCYNGATYNCNSTTISLPITRRTVWTTLGTLTSEVDTYYDSSGCGFPETVNQYDWGPTLVRWTGTSYSFNTSSGVTNPIVMDLPCGITVWNGSNQVATTTSYTYDANGNLLTEAHTNTGGSPSSVSRSFTYGSYGVLQTSKDFNGNTTTLNNTYCSNSFPSSITTAISALAASLEQHPAGELLLRPKFGDHRQLVQPNLKQSLGPHDGGHNQREWAGKHSGGLQLRPGGPDREFLAVQPLQLRDLEHLEHGV